MTKVTFEFLGTGSAFSKKFGNTCALVKVEDADTTRTIMIDCGRTTPDDLSAAGHRWTDIDAIFITHLHGDHVYGLESAGFEGKYVYGKKPHLIFPHQKLKTDLWDRVLKGTMMYDGLGDNMCFEDYFTWSVVDREDQYFMFGKVMFSVFRTEHFKDMKSYGLIVGEKDYVIYTGDSLFNKDFIDIAVSDGCQAIFHDCQLFHVDNRVHASLRDLLTLEREAKDKIFVMHYGDNLEEHVHTITNSGMRIACAGTEYIFEVNNQ